MDPEEAIENCNRQEDNNHDDPIQVSMPLRRQRPQSVLKAPFSQLGHQSYSMLHHFVIFISISFLILADLPAVENCPKQCTCDDTKLEAFCNVPIRASGIPHTLNPSLRRIIINNAFITGLSQLDTYKALEVVDVAYNNLTTIDLYSLESNEAIISLNTSHNGIYELKDSLFTDKQDLYKDMGKSKINIVELIVSHNRLTVLKDYSLARCHKLQHLDLSYNTIVLLEEDSLFGLNKLESLQLQGNRIKQLPIQALRSTIKSIPKIPGIDSEMRSLDLSGNPLDSIKSNSFDRLRQIQEINLDLCNIEFIDDDAFAGLSKLKSLSLNHNYLHAVPTGAFDALRTLKRLKLNGNSFTNIESLAFSSLYSLEELQINNGALKTITPAAFAGLDHLKRLEIANNRNLTRIDSGTIDNLPQLTYMSLYGNNLTTIRNQPTLDKYTVRILDLRNNSFHCDCDLKWLTKWLQEFNETTGETARTSNGNLIDGTNLQTTDQIGTSVLISELVNITCSGPPALAGRLIAAISDNGLECLTPSSDLNVSVGYASLILMTLILTAVCIVNFCSDKKHFIGILKENLVQSRGISMILPYSQNVRKEVDGFKQEAQLECAEYERVDYYQTNGPVYTIPSEQYSGIPQQSHQL